MLKSGNSQAVRLPKDFRYRSMKWRFPARATP
nr:AbrB/MazE/SpoVT family DNA-binding domain-containing protein [Bradyrhizobium daqingense]